MLKNVSTLHLFKLGVVGGVGKRTRVAAHGVHRCGLHAKARRRPVNGHFKHVLLAGQISRHLIACVGVEDSDVCGCAPAPSSVTLIAGHGSAGLAGAVGVLDFSNTAAAGHQSQTEHACAQNEGDLSTNHHVELKLVFKFIPLTL